MTRRIDLTGQRFGRFLVVRFSHAHKTPSGQTKSMWLCRCDCGTDRIVASQGLKQRTHQSCGCLKRERLARQRTIHGHATSAGCTPTFITWMSVISRCTKPSQPGYAAYGGRGITVCKHWMEFAHFLADMGERPSKAHSIDRIDNDGNYEPGNCRWATQKEQARNRRSNRLVTMGGKTACLIEWVEALGMNIHTVDSRIRRGWSAERALTEPVRRQCQSPQVVLP